MTPEELFYEHKDLPKKIVFTTFYSPFDICAKKGLEIDDLIQIANLSLWEACIKFDESKAKGKFSSYAINNIKHKLWGIKNKHEHGITYRGRLKRPEGIKFVSLNEECRNEEKTVLSEVVGNDPMIDKEISGKDLIDRLEKRLNERRRFILHQRVNGVGISEIAKGLNLSRQVVFNDMKAIKKEMKEVLI